jgi:hypothetical protein
VEASVAWDEFHQQIAFGLNWVKARENSEQALNTTLEQAILEQVVSLDSSQLDAVATLGQGNLVEYNDDGTVKRGSLQRLQQIRKTFFGGDGSTGLFDAMRESEDPNLINPEG